MINIVYIVLGGGQFVAQTISLALNKKKQWDLYEKNNLNWLDRESLFDIDKSIRTVCSHEVYFEEVMKMKNLVLITCNDDEDLKIIKRRGKFIDTNMEKSFVLEPRVKYHRELYNHLIDKEKKFLQIRCRDLWSSKGFLNTMKKCMSFLQLPFYEEEFSHGHKKWIQSNLAHKKKMKGDKL
jgi:hypothetical protein